MGSCGRRGGWETLRGGIFRLLASAATFNKCRLSSRPGGIRFWMNKHATVLHPDIESWNFFHKRWRGCARFRLVLIAVPRTRDAAKNNFALAERPVLMLAHVRDSGDFSIVLKNRHALPRETHDTSTVFRNVSNRTGVNKTMLVAVDVRRWIRLVFARHRLLTSAATR